MKKQFWVDIKQHSNCYKIIPFLTAFSSCLSNIYYPIFITVHMKYQVVISTVGIFKTIFYWRVTSYSLSIDNNFLGDHFVSRTNDTDFSLYSKCGRGDSGPKVIFHIKENFIVFLIYLWNPLSWIMSLFMKIDMTHLPCLSHLRKSW